MDHSAITKEKAPWIVEEILLAVDHRSKGKSRSIGCVRVAYTIALEERLVLWGQVTETDVNLLYSVRQALNRVEIIPYSELSQVYALPVLLSVLRRYFMELPESLLLQSDYDAYKTLYLSKLEESEVENRLHSVRDLVMTLPEAHFFTLNLLVSHLHKYVSCPCCYDILICRLFVIHDDDSPPLTPSSESYPHSHQMHLNALISLWGPVLLRSKQSYLTSYDRHPERVLKDLIFHYDFIFLEGKLRPASEDCISDAERKEAEATVTATVSENQRPNTMDTKQKAAEEEKRKKQELESTLKEISLDDIPVVNTDSAVPINGVDFEIGDDEESNASWSPRKSAKQAPSLHYDNSPMQSPVRSKSSSPARIFVPSKASLMDGGSGGGSGGGVIGGGNDSSDATILQNVPLSPAVQPQPASESSQEAPLF